ncbi:uncharacterized protein LOC122246485 [Penaeus japonicus]|uniref:uncharacterized protein LOC122246485 n=1 Tax=Penaeus japonicus TaxID=27405 RepID=UPI001C70C1FD|nr:uncharacterized protein LOC122246485 [Penaeus japonicus]XP_042860996.1 uncharacterized protein LOC122246485 [Penaeus japonicus]XP_042860997.1 uncharacterized protein LOC122246485 [Penaeus japonicus]
MDQLEVMPVSSRVVCLNAPHLKSLCVFEALSRTLGCYYNHHRLQVVSCQATVRLPAPRVVRIRGHATHTHPPGDTPTLRTPIQMGTYLVFHLGDWSQVKRGSLVLNGIEQVPRSAVPAKVCLQRILHSQPIVPPTPPLEPTPQSPSHLSPSTPSSTQDEQLTNGNALKKTTSLSPRANPSHPVKPPPVPPKPKISRGTKSYSLDTQSQSLTITDQSIQNIKSSLPLAEPQAQQMANICEEKPKSSVNQISLYMSQAEDVTTLLDDDDDECASDTSDDLHKVVRKRLSADITVLLDPPPENNVLVLLLKPAEETQAWQFLSACMQVTQCGKKPLVMEGTGSMKKALTRTKPLYFSKNGNVQRI